LGIASSPTQPTSYSYNTLGSLVKVSQGNQNRFFKYDSLGRLIRLKQPEQTPNSSLTISDTITGNNDWTIGSTYDANGNVLTTTDAKNIITTYTYDSLNRPLTRSYNDGTPTVTNTYDNVVNGKGRLIEVSNSISTNKFTQFDKLGRPLTNQQITEGNTYTSTYQYNLSGALIQETYPSGRIVKNDYDAKGDISKIYGQKNATATMQTYANAIGYTASGAIAKIKLGNGRWESAKFNSRLQVTELAMGSSVGDGSLWKLNYSFGELQTDDSIDASKNSGNIAKQTINFNGLANPIYQGYKYDSLNRVTEAKETANGQTTWQQNFGYDRYGNRTSFNQVVNGNQMAINNITLPNVDASTNRISSSGYVYDANGNLIQDSQNRQFTFNGDNKQTLVKDANNQVIGQYLYDGSGKRIKKITNTETTIFVYSGSKLIAEYSTQQSSTPTTSYTATDMLGSPRVITDANGQVISRRDFMAFGEEIAVGVGGRTTANKYGQSDSVRQRFTGYQKDDETGLDFAEARYYNDAHGRFTAVDPLLASGKSLNPQTFNRYVYSINRPLVLTDPTGMQTGAQKQKPKDSKPVFKIEYVEKQRLDFDGTQKVKFFGEVVTSVISVTENGTTVTPFRMVQLGGGGSVQITESVVIKSDTSVVNGKRVDTPQKIKDKTKDSQTEGGKAIFNDRDQPLVDLQGSPATSEADAQEQRDLQRTTVSEVTFTLTIDKKKVASTTIVSTQTIDTVTIVIQPPPPVVKPTPVKNPKRPARENDD
jgi:RHS repeat-associated protein